LIQPGQAAAGFESTGSNPEFLLGAVDSLTNSSVASVLSTYAASMDASLRAIGVAWLLQINYPGALAQLAKIAPLLNTEPKSIYVVSALRDYWRNTAADSTNQLVAIIDAPSTAKDLRDSAVRSLMATHTRESLVFFGRLLFSPDPTEQMDAAMAISAFVNGCDMQTPGTMPGLDHLKCSGTTAFKSEDTVANFVFRRGPPDEEFTVVTFWKNWWNIHPEIHQ